MSRSTTTLVLAALVVFALTIGLQQRFFSTVGQAVPSTTTTSKSAPALADGGSTDVPPASRPHLVPLLKNSEVSRSSEQGLGTIQAPVPPLPDRSELLRAEDSTSEDPSVRENASRNVIGRPFPVSASVTAVCRSTGGCPEQEEMLRSFAQEPRDSAWATEMEAELRKFILEDQPGKYAIRNIECRTTSCFVEVASIFGSFYGPHYDDPLKKKLFSGVGEFGFERDPSSARITVTLIPFERR